MEKGIDLENVRLKGFILDTIDINEKEINIYTFRHLKTGMPVHYMDIKDKGKAVSISVFTCPENNKGIPHIIEHSLLCGSKKYPRNSVNEIATYFDALTFNTYTTYIASCTETNHVLNLLDILLDMLLNSKSIEDINIFYQEGVRKDIGQQNELEYRGVVLNEMKGVYSNPNHILYRRILESTLKDTPYRYDHGGVPEEIKKLKHNEVVNYYNSYYHPSNMEISIYGNIDIKCILNKIAENIDSYSLKMFKRDSIQQLSFTESIVKKCNFNVYDKTLEFSTYLSLNYVVCNSKDIEVRFALRVLQRLIKLDSLGFIKFLPSPNYKEIKINYLDYLHQPIFSFYIDSLGEENLYEFRENILDALRSLIAKKIDKRLIKSVIDEVEKQILASDKSSNNWTSFINKATFLWVNEMPFNNFSNSVHWEKAKRRMMENYYFEELIERLLISNKHNSLLILSPKIIEPKKEILTDEEAEKIQKANNSFLQYQEDIKMKSKANDINLNLLKTDVFRSNDYRVISYDKVSILYSNVDLNDKISITIYFDTTMIQQEKTELLFLLGKVIGKIGTKSFSTNRLYEECSEIFKLLKIDCIAYEDLTNSGQIKPKFRISMFCKVEMLKSAFKLIDEIIHNSQFSITEICKSIKNEKILMRKTDSMYFLTNRLKSFISYSGVYNEYGGFSFYQYIDLILSKNKSEMEKLVDDLISIYENVFTKRNLIVGITCAKTQYNHSKQIVKNFIDNLYDSQTIGQCFNLKFNKGNEGLVLPNHDSVYVGKGINFRHLGYVFRGNMLVLKSAIDYYLKKKVRDFLGAYQSWFEINENGSMYMLSYRDSNIEMTLECLKGLEKFLLNLNEQQINLFINTVLNELRVLENSSQMSKIFERSYIENQICTFQNHYYDIINTNYDDIIKYCDLIGELVKNGKVCVMGNEKSMNGCSKYIDTKLLIYR